MAKGTDAQRKKVTWVVAGGNGGGHVQCLRCGQSHTFPLPMAVDAFVKASYAFIDLHATCQEPQEKKGEVAP